MTTVKEIEKAISKLHKDEFMSLREWLDKFEAEKWDEQFESDVKSGRLDKIAEKAIKSYHAGKCKEL